MHAISSYVNTFQRFQPTLGYYANRLQLVNAFVLLFNNIYRRITSQTEHKLRLAIINIKSQHHRLINVRRFSSGEILSPDLG